LLTKNFSYRYRYKGTVARWISYISEVYKTVVGTHQLVVAIVVRVRDMMGKPIGILMGPPSTLMR